MKYVKRRPRNAKFDNFSDEKYPIMKQAHTSSMTEQKLT